MTVPARDGGDGERVQPRERSLREALARPERRRLLGLLARWRRRRGGWRAATTTTTAEIILATEKKSWFCRQGRNLAQKDPGGKV